jgi:glycosyltransferase involved in cell wall biosynthesis
MSDVRNFFVVVPFYNEEKGIGATLSALAGQSDPDYSLVLVDNGSTDGSAQIAFAFAQSTSAPRVFLISEAQKGTGAASDTGFRFAISRGAKWIARTDADCLPERDWARNLKAALCDEGLEFVAGKIVPRVDEMQLGRVRHLLLRAMVWAAEHYGRIHRRGPQFKYPYFMAAGNNLGITAELYERSGGFPRSAIEDLHEDRVLSETVRTLTARAAVRKNVVVRNSVRRVRAYGYVNTLRWYGNHGYRGGAVDVR